MTKQSDTPVFKNLKYPTVDFTGGAVTIEGDNLSSISLVLVNGQGANSTKVSSDGKSVTGTFTAPFPAAFIGSQPVSVINSGKTLQTKLHIKVNGPSFNIPTNPTIDFTGGTVTITGTLLSKVSQVLVNGQGANSATVSSDGTSVKADFTSQFPASFIGCQPVTVICAGTTMHAGFDIKVEGPSITSMNPTGGAVAGGTPFTIIGERFGSGAQVQIGSTGTKDITVTQQKNKAGKEEMVLTGTTLAFPGTDVGTTQDVVLTYEGATASPPSKFTIAEIKLRSIDKPSGLICGGSSFTLTGHGLTGATEVLFGTVSVPKGDFTVVDDKTIRGTVPPGLHACKTNVTVSVQGTASNAVTYDYTLATSVPLKIDISKAVLPAGTEAYLYIIGGVKAGGTTTFYRLKSDGTPVAMSTTDNDDQAAGTFPNSNELSSAAIKALADNYKQGWADYSIPVTDGMTIDLAKINSGTIPGLGTGTAAFSGRIYLSVGVPRLPFTVNADKDGAVTGYSQPSSYGKSGQYCLYDWIEFSFDSLQNINANTTQVDGFGLSLTLSGDPTNAGTAGVTQVGLKSGVSRSDMLTTLSNLFTDNTVTAPEGTMTPGPNGATAYPSSINVGGSNILRALSPDTQSVHSLNATVDSYFDSEVDRWYTTWSSTPLVTHDLATGYYSAMASGNELQFKAGKHTSQAEWDTAGAVAFSFSKKIKTADIWQCDGMLATGDTASKNAGKIIAAAFNRGVLSSSLSDVTWTVGKFYPTGGTWNSWANATHVNGQHKLAYGFAYDDVCKQNPTVALSVPQSITISLEAF